MQGTEFRKTVLSRRRAAGAVVAAGIGQDMVRSSILRGSLAASPIR
jgi:hypothetical protein